MLILLFMTLLAFGAYVCVNRYESHLAHRAGLWMATFLGGDDVERRNSR